MLLIVRVAKDGYHLGCWATGGVYRHVRPPCKPYFWNVSHVGVQCTRRLLSKPKVPRKVWKRSCKNVYELLRKRVEMRAFESEVRFIERLAQDYGFVQKDSKTIDAAFDIEIESTGQFPKVSRNPINAIAYYSRRHQKVWTLHDMPEYEIISRLCDHVAKDDVDVVGTFSGTALDYDYPRGRASVLGVDFRLGRRDDAPYTKTSTFKSGKRVGVDKTTFLQGRICFDLYKEALFDTSLSGVRHTLKDTCKFLFGDSYIKSVDRQRLAMLSKEELGAYCLSDARITYKLLVHYLSVLKPLAIMLRIPLDMVIGRKPSHIGNLVYGRAYNKLKIISDGSNVERFTGVLW